MGATIGFLSAIRFSKGGNAMFNARIVPILVSVFASLLGLALVDSELRRPTLLSDESLYTSLGGAGDCTMATQLQNECSTCVLEGTKYRKCVDTNTTIEKSCTTWLQMGCVRCECSLVDCDGWEDEFDSLADCLTDTNATFVGVCPRPQTRCSNKACQNKTNCP